MTYKHWILTTKQKWNEFVVDYINPETNQYTESCFIQPFEEVNNCRELYT